MERGDLRSAVIAGAVTAVAWWTKYNGWLPLAIGVSGGMAAECLMPKNQRCWAATLRTLAIIVATAAGLWSPVLWDCASVGGYSAVAANHRGYLQPWSDWFRNLSHQGQNLAVYFGPVSWLGLVIACAFPWCGVISTPETAPRTTAVPGSPLSISRMVLLVGAPAVIATVLVGPAMGLLLGGAFGATGVGLMKWRRGEL
jgi:hypothetical protein